MGHVGDVFLAERMQGEPMQQPRFPARLLDELVDRLPADEYELPVSHVTLPVVSLNVSLIRATCRSMASILTCSL